MKEFLEHLAQAFGISIIRYFIIAGIPFLIFYKLFASRFTRQKIQKRSARRADFIREVKSSILSSLVFSIIGVLLLYTSVVKYTLVYNDINAYPIWWLVLSVGASLVIHDTYFYWMHRLLHHKAIFKHAHVLHHKSVSPSPWSSYSFHFLEAIPEGGVLVLLAFTLPMHPIAIMLFILLGFAINVYGHLGYELMPRGFRHTVLFEILNSSVHHNVHHSRFTGNYGLYFRVWDRLMGTEHPDYVKEYDRVQAERFGPEAQKASFTPALQPITKPDAGN